MIWALLVFIFLVWACGFHDPETWRMIKSKGDFQEYKKISKEPVIQNLVKIEKHIEREQAKVPVSTGLMRSGSVFK